MMNWSLSALFGDLGLKRISPKNRAAIRSAHDRQEVGCPDPAAVVAIRESRRKIAAIWFNSFIEGICIEEKGDIKR
tara:strand:+ start:555 stop:782 length:228 start_codon:yes stop_codon:yes gene_type:complete